jgi:hypothetical protein
VRFIISILVSITVELSMRVRGAIPNIKLNLIDSEYKGDFFRHSDFKFFGLSARMILIPSDLGVWFSFPRSYMYDVLFLGLTCMMFFSSVVDVV